MRLPSAAIFCLVLAPSAPCAGQVVFEGRPGLLLANDRLELTVLIQGASLANLTLKEDPEKLSPLWNPSRMARELGAKPGGGAGLGHFVCVDGFGPVSPEEQAAGLQGHGEAHRQQMEVRAAGRDRVTLAARLPLLQENFTRTIRLVDGEQVVYVETELENLLAFDRPVCWAEHATIGSPFLQPWKTVVDMPAARSLTRRHPPKPGALPRRLKSFEEFTWPMAPAVAGGVLDLRAAPANPNSIDHTTCLLDPGREFVWVTALNTEKRLLVGYVFRRSEFPWLQNWENYQPTLKMARGIEFSTMPFDVPRREAIDTHELLGGPTYRWLPAKSKIGSRFLLFYARAPEGMRKVDDVRLEAGKLIVEDRGAGQRLTLAASGGL